MHSEMESVRSAVRLSSKGKKNISLAQEKKKFDEEALQKKKKKRGSVLQGSARKASWGSTSDLTWRRSTLWIEDDENNMPSRPPIYDEAIASLRYVGNQPKKNLTFRPISWKTRHACIKRPKTAVSLRQVTVATPALPDAPVYPENRVGATPRYDSHGHIVPHSLLGEVSSYLQMQKGQTQWKAGRRTYPSMFKNPYFLPQPDPPCLVINLDPYRPRFYTRSLDSSKALENWSHNLCARERNRAKISEKTGRNPTEMVMGEVRTNWKYGIAPLRTGLQSFLQQRGPWESISKWPHHCYVKPAEIIHWEPEIIEATQTRAEQGILPDPLRIGVPAAILREKGYPSERLRKSCLPHAEPPDLPRLFVAGKWMIFSKRQSLTTSDKGVPVTTHQKKAFLKPIAEAERIIEEDEDEMEEGLEEEQIHASQSFSNSGSGGTDKMVSESSEENPCSTCGSGVLCLCRSDPSVEHIRQDSLVKGDIEPLCESEPDLNQDGSLQEAEAVTGPSQHMKYLAKRKRLSRKKKGGQAKDLGMRESHRDIHKPSKKSLTPKTSSRNLHEFLDMDPEEIRLVDKFIRKHSTLEEDEEYELRSAEATDSNSSNARFVLEGNITQNNNISQEEDAQTHSIKNRLLLSSLVAEPASGTVNNVHQNHKRAPIVDRHGVNSYNFLRRPYSNIGTSQLESRTLSIGIGRGNWSKIHGADLASRLLSEYALNTNTSGKIDAGDGFRFGTTAVSEYPAEMYTSDKSDEDASLRAKSGESSRNSSLQKDDVLSVGEIAEWEIMKEDKKKIKNVPKLLLTNERTYKKRGPSILFCGQRAAWSTGKCPESKMIQRAIKGHVHFSAKANILYADQFEIMNTGITAVFYKWNKFRADELSMRQKVKQRFYIDDTDGVIHPGQRLYMSVNFRSAEPGLFYEVWKFDTQPVMCGGAYLLLRLSAVVFKPESDYTLQKRRQIEEELQHRMNNQISLDITRLIVNSAPLERPQEPLKPVILKELPVYAEDYLFNSANQPLEYHSSEYMEMTTLSQRLLDVGILQKPAFDTLGIQKGLLKVACVADEHEDLRMEAVGSLNRIITNLSFRASRIRRIRKRAAVCVVHTLMKISFDDFCHQACRLRTNRGLECICASFIRQGRQMCPWRCSAVSQLPDDNFDPRRQQHVLSQERSSVSTKSAEWKQDTVPADPESIDSSVLECKDTITPEELEKRERVFKKDLYNVTYNLLSMLIEKIYTVLDDLIPLTPEVMMDTLERRQRESDQFL